MLTLYTFGPDFGLPDPSPFVIKTLVLLKMANLEFQTARADMRKAPKGKVPYLRDGATIIPDSTFIRFHLEDNYGIDFDPGLDDAQKGVAWAYEKLCEDNLYFCIVRDRWSNDENFKRGPARFFKQVPAMLRPLIVYQVRRGVNKVMLYGQGTGRHTDEEVARLALKDLTAISDFLADKPYLMGDVPCGADASVFAHVTSCLCPLFESATRANAERIENLKAYNNRCMKQWFPEFVTA